MILQLNPCLFSVDACAQSPPIHRLLGSRDYMEKKTQIDIKLSLGMCTLH